MIVVGEGWLKEFRVLIINSKIEANENTDGHYRMCNIHIY